jgi:lincosamide nucleotidyltransferase A/C/D/E
MTAKDVIEVVGRLERAGLNYWLDGGWGVDALAGEETRVHDDLDACVELRETDGIADLLAPLGFRVTLDERPTRMVLGDDTGRRIDLHPLVLDDEGNGRQLGAGPNGGDAVYPADGLKAVGKVEGESVPCLSPQLLLLHHTGYEPQEKDWHNVRVLCERFGLPVPRGYADHGRVMR